MDRKKIYKRGLFTLAATIAAVIIFLVIKLLTDIPYRKNIPEIPEKSVLSTPVREQLVSAGRTAHLNPAADNLGAFGLAFHSNALYDQAKQCYLLAIKKDKTKWVWSYYLGLLNQEMGNVNEAIKNFTSVVEVNRKAYTAWYHLGKDYEKTASNDNAEQAFNKLIDIQDNISYIRSSRINYSPLALSAKYELARIYLNTNRPDQAEKTLLEIVQKNHSMGASYRLLGNVLNAKGDSVSGLKYTVRAQDLADVLPVNDTLSDKLALMSRSEQYLPKQIDEAIKSANPEWALQLIKHGLQYLSGDKYMVSKAVKFYIRMDTGKEALPYLGKNFNDFTDDFNETREVGDLLYRKGFYNEALPYFKRMNVIKPEYLEIQTDYANCFWMAGKKDSSQVIISDLIRKNPDNAEILEKSTAYMISTGQIEKAESLLSALKKIAPSRPACYKLAGMIAENKGKTGDAIVFYRKAFSDDPADLETIQKLGSLLLDQKNWSDAISLFRSSLRSHPNESFLLERLGSLLVTCPDPQQRNVIEGMELLERAFYHISSTSATTISAGKNLAQGFAMVGDFQSATYYMGLTLSLAQNNNVPEVYMESLKNLAIKISRFGQRK